MRKLLNIFLSITVLLSLFSFVSGAVTYADLDITYSPSSDYTDYVDVNAYDRLQYRSSTYGYALRIHYGLETLPTGESFYEQLPGEFHDKTSSEMTYFDLMYYYPSDTNDDGKAYDVYTVGASIANDCNTLGYNFTACGVYDADDSFVPTSASAGSRLVALVVTEQGDEYHFYTQTSDNKWTHKFEDEQATTRCVECNVPLTNNNFSSHIHCKVESSNNAVRFDGEVLLFTITAPGSSDRYHSNGHVYSMYYTPTSGLSVPGDYLKSAHHFPQSVTSLTFPEKIEYIGDEDYYMFNVFAAKNHTITLTKGTNYAYRVYFGEVSDSLAPTSTTVHSVAAGTSTITFTKSLIPGKRYYIKVIAYGQTDFDSAMSYTITIS